MKLAALMYHEIGADSRSPNRYAVSRNDFIVQMEYLHENGFRSLLVDEYFCGPLDPSQSASEKEVMITFDDGYLSDYSIALGILQKYRLRATFFVTTGLLGKHPRWMTAEHLIELHRQGMSVQSHSHTHAFLSDISPAEIEDDLRRSKEMLEGILGAQVNYLSCPGGRYNRTVIEMARRLGFRGICTSRPDSNDRGDGGTNGLVNRFLISDSTTRRAFQAIVNLDRAYLRRVRALYKLKSFLKALIGGRLYHKIWRKFH